MSENSKDCPPDDLIRMALSDKVSFEEIYKKHGLTEKEVKVIMKTHLKLSSYINWRKGELSKDNTNIVRNTLQNEI